MYESMVSPTVRLNLVADPSRRDRVLVRPHQGFDDYILHRHWPNLRLGRHQEPPRACKPALRTHTYIPSEPFKGLANFQNSQAFIGGFGNFAQTFVYAFYSFGGIELVAVAAGESSQPHKSVPRAIKATFWRIVLFYVLAILTMGLCINHADDTLLSSAFGEFCGLA